MRVRELSCSAVSGALLLAGIPTSMRAQTTAPTPYASISTEGESYAGPGRASENDLTGQIVLIGLLAPLRGARKAEGDAMVAAAQMAIDDAAPQRLSGGRRVALALEDSSGPSWGVVSDAVIRLMLDDQAVTVITSSSRTDTHLCEQVGNRIGVPVLMLSSDPTATQIDIPWIFRMGPSDIQEAEAIAHEIYGVRKLQTVLLVTEKNHENSLVIHELNQAALAIHAPAPRQIALDESQQDLEPIMKEIEAERPQAVLIWTGPSTAATLLRALRIAGVKTLRYLSQHASSEMHEALTTELAAADVWRIAANREPSSDRQEFAARFQQATGSTPSSIASQTYDAVSLTVRALQVAGPNRARIRDEVATTTNYDGVSGRISFDREGNDTVAVHFIQLK